MHIPLWIRDFYIIFLELLKDLVIQLAFQYPGFVAVFSRPDPKDKIEAAVARWKHWLANDPLTDITCLYMVEEGTQPVASLFNWPRTSDDPRKGWIGSLGVLRPWRKHGLGRALLLHSFQEFKKRGLLRAGLGVDASNLTGALRLYEKAGMHVEQTTLTYEVELQPGKNLMTQTLES